MLASTLEHAARTRLVGGFVNGEDQRRAPPISREPAEEDARTRSRRSPAALRPTLPSRS